MLDVGVRLIDVAAFESVLIDAFLDAFAELLGRRTNRTCKLWQLRSAKQEQDHHKDQDDLGATDVS